MAAPGGKLLKDMSETTLRARAAELRRRPPDGKNTDPPLPDAPSHLDIAEAYCWRALRSEMPWLTISDSTLVEMAAKLRARLMTDTLDPRQYTTLRGLMVQLTGTPLSRDRMRHRPDEEGTENSDLFG